MLSLEIGYSEDYAPYLNDYTDEYRLAVIRQLAARLLVELQGLRSFWPVDTGLSIRNFKYRIKENGELIEFYNQIRYARPVNYKRRYPSGKRNPNAYSLERTLLAGFDRAFRIAIRLAEKEVQGRYGRFNRKPSLLKGSQQNQLRTGD